MTRMDMHAPKPEGEGGAAQPMGSAATGMADMSAHPAHSN
jgi:hypothetical protein